MPAISIALVVLSAAFILGSAAAEQPEFIQIITIDNYEKTVAAGESATFNWTIRNVDSLANLTVTFEAAIVNDGWSAELNASSLTLAPGELASVTATVHSPFEWGDVTSNLTVVFNVYEDGFLVQVSSVSATTEIIGAFGSANKVLWLFDNPLPSPLDNEWGVFLLDVILWFVIAVGIAYLMDAVAYAITRKTTTMLDDIILGIIRTPVLLLVFVFGLVNSLDALHEHIPLNIRELVLSIYSVAIVLVIFYLAYKLFKQIIVYYGKMIAKKTASNIDDVLIPIVEKLGIVVIGIAALGYLMNVLSIDLTMFLAGGVVISMVLAFAAEDTLSNFFSGVFLLLDRPFAEGDMIILTDGDWCEVRRIGLRTCRLYRYSDATEIALPNNKLVNEKIVRVSNVTDPARVNVDVNVAYGSDPKVVRQAITKAIETSRYSLLNNESCKPLILFDSMGDTALLFKVICWINDNSKRMEARDLLVEEIYLKLSDAGIEVPLPQRVVTIKKE
ncbi:MAG: Mechanosensitive ion channel [Candidatus Thermoplasmatota archaeon]|nr:Mechanosensitive ion channel [Candidatus Thermoplasmatota archaeon]